MKNPKINISTDAGRIALCKSWARTFTDKTYGLNTSISITNVSTIHRYTEWLEKQRNEADNHHIPIGYYYDLIDGVDLTEIAYDRDYLSNTTNYTIIDGISGITNQQMFSLLDATVTSPSLFTTKLKNSGYLTGSNTNTALDNLFNSY